VANANTPHSPLANAQAKPLKRIGEWQMANGKWQIKIKMRKTEWDFHPKANATLIYFAEANWQMANALNDRRLKAKRQI